MLGAAVQSFGSVTGVRTTVTVSEGQRRMDPRVEILIHRLVMDILADAQACGARNAWVSLTTSVAGPANVDVSHDGDPRTRARTFRDPALEGLDATLFVRTEPNGRTTVNLTVQEPTPRRRVPGSASDAKEDPWASTSCSSTTTPSCARPWPAMLGAQDDITVVGQAGSLADGHALLDRVFTAPPEGRLVAVIDVNMPDGSGLSLVRAARERYKDIGLVVLTMLNDDSTLLEALDAGASALVRKSAPSEQVISAVRRAAEMPGEFCASGLAEAMRRAGETPRRPPSPPARPRCSAARRGRVGGPGRPSALHEPVDGQDPHRQDLREARRAQPGQRRHRRGAPRPRRRRRAVRPGAPDAERRSAPDARAGQQAPLEKVSTMRMAPGPMMTMNSAGKMQSRSGKRIFTVTFCAFSSAR